MIFTMDGLKKRLPTAMIVGAIVLVCLFLFSGLIYKSLRLARLGFVESEEKNALFLLDNAFSTDFERVFGDYEKNIFLRDNFGTYICYVRIKAEKEDQKLLGEALYNGQNNFDSFRGGGSYFACDFPPIKSWWDAYKRPTRIYTGKSTHKGDLTLTTALGENCVYIYIRADWKRWITAWEGIQR
jgi:hypothetical protein